MEKKKAVLLTAGSLAAALGLGAGAWAGLRYWTGDDFTPGEIDRALRKNQVLFQQEDPEAAMNQEGGEDSARWEKDAQAENSESSQTDQEGNYLFRTDDSHPAGSTGGILDENGQGIGDGGNTPDHIFTPGGDGGDNISGGDTGGGAKTDGDEAPSDYVPPKDPENPDKGNPTPDWGSKDNPFNEDTFEPNPWWDDFMATFYIRQADDAEYPLYVGQSVDERTIFNSLLTSFLDADGNRSLLNWSHYGKYIRISGVSFDNGNTWTDRFPVTIPEGMDPYGMQFKMEYRFRNSSTEPWNATPVVYEPYAGRVMCLSQEPEKGTDTVDASTILNADRQYLNLGDTLNLTQYQPYMLYGTSFDGSMLYTPLTKLFPGWWENGQKMPMIYTVGYGRHVLIPGKLVDAPENVTICLGVYEKDGEDLLLQTMIDGAPDADGTLRVPNYVQAVQMDGETVEKMVLSASVVLLPNSDVSQPIAVKTAFEVAADNPFFSAQDGLLLDAAGTTLLGVPSSILDLTVPEQAEVLRPLRSNCVESLHLQGQTLPEIDFDCFPNLKDVCVTEEMLASISADDLQKLADAGITVWTEDESTYRKVDGFLLDNNQGVRRILDTTLTRATLPGQAQKLCAGAFRDAEELVTLVVPEEIEDLELEQGCFDDSGLRILLCANEEQVKRLTERLEKIGEKTVFAAVLAQTPDGYQYIPLSDGTARLVSAPETLTEFTGVENLTVSEIAEGAFAGCTALRWAEMPASIFRVESEAFSGCTALEGIVFRYKNSGDVPMTVKANVFDGCAALRFVAYSAMLGDVSEDVGSDVSCCAYWPSEAQGYPTGTYYSPVNWIMTAPDYEFYTDDSLDALGERLLITREGDNFVVLRSGNQVPEQLVLPAETTEIGPNAFENVAGSFTVDWAGCPKLEFLDPYAFRNSGLAGDVTIKTDYISVGMQAFDGTDITSFSANTAGVGMDAFVDCGALQTAAFTLAEGEELSAGTFANCYALELVTMGNEEPFSLVLQGDGGISFYLRDFSEENLLELPEDAREVFVQSWLYPFTGYATEKELRAALAQWISDPEELEAEEERMVLEAENRIRTLLVGLEPIEENGFAVEENGGLLTLTGAPEDAVDVVLDWQTLGLEERAYLDYIAAGAFAGCTQLERVTTCEGLAGIWSGAFSTGGDALELVLNGSTPPNLILEEDGSFSFGLEDAQITLTVPEALRQTYLDHWKANLAGYADYEDARSNVAEAHPKWSAEKVKWTVDRNLRSYENRLRAMMGLAPATEGCGTEPVRDGLRLFAAPAGVEIADLTDLGGKLLEINADAFKDCSLLEKVVLPNTVDAITAKAFTCAAEHLTLDMTAWPKEMTLPKLILLDDEPFTFGLTKEDARVEIRVENEEVRQKLIEAWTPFFAGADSREALVEKLESSYLTQEGKTELTPEERSALETEADTLLARARARLEEMITYCIPEETETAGETVREKKEIEIHGSGTIQADY